MHFVLFPLGVGGDLATSFWGGLLVGGSARLKTGQPPVA